MNCHLKHLPEDLIIEELKNNPSTAITQFIEHLNQKYNTTENYGYVYQIIKRNNLFSYITKTKEHNSLEKLASNQELINFLYKHNHQKLFVCDLLKLIEQELHLKLTKYILKRLILYLNLDYITNHEQKCHYELNTELTEKQKNKVKKFCKINNIDINNVHFKDLKKLYDNFQYNYLANLMFLQVNKYTKDILLNNE